MSIPYYSAGADTFNFPRVNDKSYVEFPFLSLGDKQTKIYHINCTMRKDAYRQNRIFSFVLAGISAGNGTYSLVNDATINDRQYYEATIGGNVHRVDISAGKWRIVDTNDFNPLFTQTDSNDYPFPWDVPAWTAVVGTGTPALTTQDLIPDLNVTLNSTNAAVLGLPVDFHDSNAYYIGDYNHSADGDMISFDRQFANIPQPHSRNSGTEIYSFPGLPSVAGTGSDINVNSITSSSNVVTLTLASAHGMSVGDYAFINLKLTRTIASAGFTRTLTQYAFGLRQAVTGTTGSTFKFKGNLDGFALVGTGTFKSNATLGRSQVSRTSPTDIVSDYYLPGVSAGISQAQDIAIQEPFRPYRYSEGNEVTVLSTASTPTADEYRDIVATDGYLVMSENVKKWKGNILVKESKQIRAL